MEAINEITNAANKECLKAELNCEFAVAKLTSLKAKKRLREELAGSYHNMAKMTTEGVTKANQAKADLLKFYIDIQDVDQCDGFTINNAKAEKGLEDVYKILLERIRDEAWNNKAAKIAKA